nr:MAG TPA: hypothetical protein [Caudoviricetes sp.]
MISPLSFIFIIYSCIIFFDRIMTYAELLGNK